MAYIKKHCPGCCPGCNNGYAQADCTGNTSIGSCGSASCGHNHGGSCSHNCSACGSGCNTCGRRNNGFGTLRSVTGPFSNCGNWWNNSDCFPYYTGPCGPCEPCKNCCCPDWPWPWPWPPVMPVSTTTHMNHCDYSYPVSESCACRDSANYTSHKNCYRTEDSHHDACAARQVKPIVDCNGCKHHCDCED